MDCGDGGTGEQIRSYGDACGDYLTRREKMKDTFRKVKEVIGNVCGAQEIKEDDLLKEELGVDSLALVEVVAELEDKFSVEFDMGSLNPDELMTVADLVSLVENAL